MDVPSSRPYNRSSDGATGPKGPFIRRFDAALKGRSFPVAWRSRGGSVHMVARRACSVFAVVRADDSSAFERIRDS